MLLLLTTVPTGAVLAIAHRRGFAVDSASYDQFATAGVDGSVMFWQWDLADGGVRVEQIVADAES